MTVIYQRPSLADVRGLSTVLMRSFSPLQQYQSLFDIGSVATADAVTLARKDEEILTIWDAAFSKYLCDSRWFHYTAVDDDTGHIVGFCGWLAPKSLPQRRTSLPFRNRILHYWYALKETFLTYVPLAIKALWHPTLGRRYLQQRLRRNAMMARIVDMHLTNRERREGYWYLGFLCIDPAYERKGIARALLKEGLRMAEEDDMPVWLTSTPTGKGLYERLGFETFETEESTDGPHGTWKEYSMRLGRRSQRSEKV